MAVKKITAIERWSGLSTDAKPTGATLVGSEFFETDTGHSYCWNGTVWNVFSAIDGGITGAQIVADIVHHEVHKGKYFTATHAETLASGSASIILMETPGSATTAIHFLSSFSTSAAGTILFSRIPNATVGTKVTGYNNNDTVGGSGELSITHSGAVTTTGNLLETLAIGAANPNVKIGGQTGLRNEWMLNHDARYLLKFQSSAATNVAWNIMWYEEPQ